jgi:hypothetical protein
MAAPGPAGLRMNGSVALASALSFIAAGEGIPRKVVCLCNYCVEDLDPRGEFPAHRAPDSSECERCADPVRWRMGGFCFLVMPAEIGSGPVDLSGLG